MRVLVTGHHGYVGSVLSSVLARAGHAITGLDTFFYEGCDLWDERQALPVLGRDVRDVRPADLTEFDAIVHLAGLSNDPLGALNADLTYEINAQASAELGRAAREAGVSRFIFASSCSMYGTSGIEGKVDETAPLAPLTAYAKSKVQAEDGLRALADDRFSPVFMRNATVYGVSPRLRIDLVLNNLVGWAFTTGKVRVLSDGTPWRPLVHVRDVSAATLALLEAPRDVVHNEAFNVGADSENYQVRDLAEIVRDTVPDCDVEYAADGNPDPRSYRVDFGKFHRALPKAGLGWSAERGAHELLAAYRAAALRPEQLEDASFTRLRSLQQRLDAGELDESLRWTDVARASLPS
jgi:nucleoside-diphosphate-sugar epimerase